MIKEIIKFRQELHKYPELSNQEFQTSQRISDFVSRFKPNEELTLCKTGKAFVFNGIEKGKTLVFRAELDALPIKESSGLNYSSVNNGVSHVCGHDGHMAILAGLAQKISENRPKKGKVVLLFQPAEEVEQGAKDIIEDKNFKRIEPDYIFALHNVPGYKKHDVLIKKSSFTSASKGLTIKLIGKTSHAAEPEKGINPSLAISEIINKLNLLIKNKGLFSDLTILTFIYIRMGEISFGTSAGSAEMGITLRAFENADMDLLTEKVETIVKEVSNEKSLKIEFSYNEIFPSVVNDNYCVDLVKRAAQSSEYKVNELQNPFKWSEDFAYYTQKYKGGFFGLASGLNQPALHNPNFNFPDEIIETGINVFYNIYRKLGF